MSPAMLFATLSMVTSCGVTKVAYPNQQGLKNNLVYKTYSSKYPNGVDYASYGKLSKTYALGLDSTNVINP